MAVRRSVFDSEERETPCRGKAGAVLPVNGLAKKSGKKGTKKISRCARNDSVGDGYPVHHTKNVWKRRVSRIVIPSGVEGSFSLMVRRRASDGEKWETPSHGKADGVSRKRLSEGGGKRGTEKISRCARNDSVGDGYPVHHTKNVWEKRVSRIVIPSEVEGSFSLAVRRRVTDGEKRETPYRGKAVCLGNKKRGGIPLFLFISMAAQAALSTHLRYLRSRLRRGERALRGCRSRRRRRCRGDGCHARHLRHSRYHRS